MEEKICEQSKCNNETVAHYFSNMGYNWHTGFRRFNFWSKLVKLQKSAFCPKLVTATDLRKQVAYECKLKVEHKALKQHVKDYFQRVLRGDNLPFPQTCPFLSIFVVFCFTLLYIVRIMKLCLKYVWMPHEVLQMLCTRSDTGNGFLVLLHFWKHSLAIKKFKIKICCCRLHVAYDKRLLTYLATHLTKKV